jgi:hypothetical protein
MSFGIGEYAVEAYKVLCYSMWGFVNSSGAEYSYTSDVVQGVWHNNNDLAGWITHLATSLSNNIRRTAPAPWYPAYAGTAYSMVPYVQVHWTWLALPAALVLGTIGSLFATMWSTAQRGVSAWKSDPLPLLFVGVDQATLNLVADGLDEDDGIKDSLGEHGVRLTRTSERGWSFQSG